MTRIENESGEDNRLEGVQTEIERLKKELKRKQSKKFFNCGTCLIIFLLVIFAFGVTVSYLLAKSGLRTLPVFTDYFYKTPQPSYLVENITWEQKVLLNRLISAVEKQAVIQKKTENFSVFLPLADKEITALLREQMAKDQSFKDRIDYWQVAVLPENIEMFLVFKKPKNLIISLNIKPEIRDGALNLNVQRFAVGDLNLPKFVGSLLVENIGEKIIHKYLNSWKQAGKIEEISAINKQVEIKILINNLNNFSDAF